MAAPLILASASPARRRLLERAGITPRVTPAGIDEDMIMDSMRADNASVETVVGALAEAKARKVSARNPESLVIGADQIAELQGKPFGKPADRQEARAQLHALSGQTHHLCVSVTVAKDGEAIWNHFDSAAMTMRPLSHHAIDRYLERSYDRAKHSCGCYMIEEDGVRLFRDIQGDFFTIQGMPLLKLIDFLIARGTVTP